MLFLKLLNLKNLDLQELIANSNFNNDRIDCYKDLITEIYRTKNSFFQYENELRIVLTYENIDKDTKIETMIKDNTIKFYIDMEFKEDWNGLIDYIIISPFNKNECVKENIYDFLVMNGITLDKDNIIFSECPIR